MSGIKIDFAAYPTFDVPAAAPPQVPSAVDVSAVAPPQVPSAVEHVDPSMPAEPASSSILDEMLASFSKAVQARFRAVYADQASGALRPFKRVLAIIEDIHATEAAGVLCMYDALYRHGEDEFLSVLDLAVLTNHAGNASSRLGRVEASLRLHKQASRLLASAAGVVDGARGGDDLAACDAYAYGLCQQVNRCVVLKRLDEALDVVRVLAAMEQVHTNGWVRNRFWEATLMATEDNIQQRPQQVLAFVQQALAVSPFSPTTYTVTAHIMLLNRRALCMRSLKRLDEAHDTCLVVKSMISHLTEAQRDHVAWGLLEGAFIGRLRQRPADMLLFLKALPKVAPLQDCDTSYAAILRAAALIAMGKLREAEASLDGVGTPTVGWVIAGATCVRAELALAKGDVALANTLAQTVVATYGSDRDCDDEVERAQKMLAAHG